MINSLKLLHSAVYLKMTTDFSFKLDKFLKNIFIKKQYLQKLKKQASIINTVKQQNYKLITQKVFKNTSTQLINNSIIYIIDFMISRSNTFLHVTDASGKLKFFCSAGHLQHKGKNKKSRITVFKSFYRILITKLKFLKNKPIALHLKNVGFNRFFIIKTLKKKFFIQTVKIFNFFPFNGCRKKKVRRTKIKKKNEEEMAEWFKAADCKSVEFSHRRFKSFFLQMFFSKNIRNIT